jgi:hypothetical protein
MAVNARTLHFVSLLVFLVLLPSTSATRHHKEDDRIDTESAALSSFFDLPFARSVLSHFLDDGKGLAKRALQQVPNYFDNNNVFDANPFDESQKQDPFLISDGGDVTITEYNSAPIYTPMYSPDIYYPPSPPTTVPPSPPSPAPLPGGGGGGGSPVGLPDAPPPPPPSMNPPPMNPPPMMPPATSLSFLPPSPPPPSPAAGSGPSEVQTVIYESTYNGIDYAEVLTVQVEFEQSIVDDLAAFTELPADDITVLTLEPGATAARLLLQSTGSVIATVSQKISTMSAAQIAALVARVTSNPNGVFAGTMVKYKLSGVSIKAGGSAPPPPRPPPPPSTSLHPPPPGSGAVTSTANILLMVVISLASIALTGFV